MHRYQRTGPLWLSGTPAHRPRHHPYLHRRRHLHPCRRRGEVCLLAAAWPCRGVLLGQRVQERFLVRVREMAEEEVAEARGKLEAIEARLQRMLLPKDPKDGRNVFLEIRAGTGGDEAAIFSADLFRMYSRYAERQGWRVEILSESPGEHGGYK